MKMNNPVCVMRYIRTGLSMTKSGLKQLTESAEKGEPVKPVRLKNILGFVDELHKLSVISLKLSDPEEEYKTLTEEEKEFITNFYLPTPEDLQQEEEDE